MNLLTGKTAIVTGGAGGIGSAISKKQAANGVAVIVTYNSNAGKAQHLLNELPGADHSIFHAPVNDSDSVNKLSTFVAEKYGKLDILVNNAGITTPIAHDDLDGLTDEWIDKIFTTNVRGSFAMIRACKALLLKSEDGLVVNIHL